MIHLSYSIEAYCITLAFCGFFHIALSLNVSRHRRRVQVAIGHADDYRLHAAIRAFGNFSEYMPITMLLIGVNTFMGAHKDLIFSMCFLFLVSRILHVVSLLHFEQTPLPTVFYRLIAIGINYFVIILSAILLLTEMLTNNFNPF